MDKENIIYKLKQYCPDGKIINPHTERCVKTNGKVAKNMLADYTGDGSIPECTIAKVRNPQSGRCVKITGKVGQSILSKYEVIDVHIIFHPELFVIWNSSYKPGSKTKKKPIVWDSLNIGKFLKWYQSFSAKVKTRLVHHNIVFMQFSVYGNNIDLHLRVNKKDVPVSKLVQMLSELKRYKEHKFKNTSEVVNDLLYALEPDIDEDYLIENDGELYIMQAPEIANFVLTPQK
jgi:hypothetical protein